MERSIIAQEKFTKVVIRNSLSHENLRQRFKQEGSLYWQKRSNKNGLHLIANRLRFQTFVVYLSWIIPWIAIAKESMFGPHHFNHFGKRELTSTCKQFSQLSDCRSRSSRVCAITHYADGDCVDNLKPIKLPADLVRDRSIDESLLRNKLEPHRRLMTLEARRDAGKCVSCICRWAKRQT